MTIEITTCADGADVQAAAVDCIEHDPAGMALVAGVAALPGAWSALIAVDGATDVALFTDLVNPTSNRLPAEIGFAPVSDSERRFWRVP